MLAQEKAAQNIDPEDLLEIQYEDLCQDPVGTTKLAVGFSRLDWSPAFEDTVRRLSFENRNDRWRRELSTEQQVMLNECLYDALRRYGYA